MGLERDVAQDGAPAARDRDIFGRQQGHGATLRMRTTSQKKNGVPSRLVKTPSRNSGSGMHQPGGDIGAEQQQRAGKRRRAAAPGAG